MFDQLVLDSPSVKIYDENINGKSVGTLLYVNVRVEPSYTLTPYTGHHPVTGISCRSIDLIVYGTNRKLRPWPFRRTVTFKTPNTFGTSYTSFDTYLFECTISSLSLSLFLPLSLYVFNSFSSSFPPFPLFFGPTLVLGLSPHFTVQDLSLSNPKFIKSSTH